MGKTLTMRECLDRAYLATLRVGRIRLAWMLPLLEDDNLIHTSHAPFMGLGLAAPVVPGVALAAYARQLADYVSLFHREKRFSSLPSRRAFLRQETRFREEPLYVSETLDLEARLTETDGQRIVVTAAVRGAERFSSTITYASHREIPEGGEAAADSPLAETEVAQRRREALGWRLGLPYRNIIPFDDASYALVKAVPLLQDVKRHHECEDVRKGVFVIGGHSVEALPRPPAGPERESALDRLSIDSLRFKKLQGQTIGMAHSTGYVGGRPAYALTFSLVERPR